MIDEVAKSKFQIGQMVKIKREAFHHYILHIKDEQHKIKTIHPDDGMGENGIHYVLDGAVWMDTKYLSDIWFPEDDLEAA